MTVAATSTDKLVVYVGADPSTGWYWQRESSTGAVVTTSLPFNTQALAQTAAWNANQDLIKTYKAASNVPVRTQTTAS